MFELLHECEVAVRWFEAVFVLASCHWIAWTRFVSERCP